MPKMTISQDKTYFGKYHLVFKPSAVCVYKKNKTWQGRNMIKCEKGMAFDLVQQLLQFGIIVGQCLIFLKNTAAVLAVLSMLVKLIPAII